MSEKKLKTMPPHLKESTKRPMSDDLIGSSEQKKDYDYIHDQSKPMLRIRNELALTKALNILLNREKYILMEDHYDDLLLEADKQNKEMKHEDFGELFSRLGSELVMECLIRCSRGEYGMISLVNKSFMSIIGDKELYRMRRSMGFVEPWIYFMAEVHQWKAYDPTLRRFMDLPRLTSSNESFQVGCLAVGTELLVFPMNKCFNIINKYNVMSNTWKTGLSAFNIPRWYFGAASKGEIAIFVGGRATTNVILSSVELYNSEFGTWTQLPNMKRARIKCSVVFLGGKVYVIGGIGENNEILTSGEVFDFDKKIWSEIPGMWPTRTNRLIRFRPPPLVAVVNDQLYAADHLGNQVLSYNIGNNTWSSIGNFPERAKSLTGLDISFMGCGNRLLLISRRTKGCYDFELNACMPIQDQLQWELLARMRRPSCAVMEC